MRIAYIAPYQGPTLVEKRPIIRNLSLAGRVKTERIAEALRKCSHEVEILSQGEVIEHALKIYPGYSDFSSSDKSIPVFYSSAFPVRFLNGLWSTVSLLRIFKQRNKSRAFDLVLIYNLKPPQVFCARYALRRLGIPVILEYEDDAFMDRAGQQDGAFTGRFYLAAAKRLLKSVSGSTGVTPRLLSQTPASIPKMLLRGVIGDEIVKEACQSQDSKQNWVVFSGTLGRTYGLEQLIAAWQIANLPGWELHIAGDGEMRDTVQRVAKGDKRIVLRGLLNRLENARLLASAKISINPHDLSENPGNIFAFKIVEYLAAGTHLITTPMGALESELERGITYLADNTPETIAAILRQVIETRSYERTAAEAAIKTYGPNAMATALDELFQRVIGPAPTSPTSKVKRRSEVTGQPVTP